VFAVSFSKERDLLSQWRGYATGAGGPFCIGFPSAMLRERVDAGEGLVWSLRKCIYSCDEQAELIEARIFGAVMEVAPLCKHPAFAEEREWRLLFGPVSVKKVESVHFVERRHTLAPYIEFRLAEGDNVLDHIQWIAGPGPQQERANSAPGMVAQTAGMTRYHGMPSHTPYLP